MRILLLLAGLTLSLAALPQEIYRWVDKDGVVHYSDQPGAPGAELIVLTVPNSYEPAPTDLGAAGGGGSTYQPQLPPYESLTIVQPQPDQVYFGADVALTVVAELGGVLQSGHTLVFIVNGNRRPADAGFTLQLTNLERGTHFLRATVIDQAGAPLISSEQISIHVRQPSINTPQSPQRPRPPAPAPRPAT
ncbi:MAG TPA: DUF4124 domain-containing protein [Steroidobacteraceae bacterium]|nr:DUF4124 domain-containing protein [Steroidobacteraceae bacterium]